MKELLCGKFSLSIFCSGGFSFGGGGGALGQKPGKNPPPRVHSSMFWRAHACAYYPTPPVPDNWAQDASAPSWSHLLSWLHPINRTQEGELAGQ